MFCLRSATRNSPDGANDRDGWKTPIDVVRCANIFDRMRVKEKIKRIDYVLVHSKKTPDEETDPDEKKVLQRRIKLRHRFEAALVDEKIEIQADSYGEKDYLKLHVPFERLCKEAEHVKLDMPLHGVSRHIFFTS